MKDLPSPLSRSLTETQMDLLSFLLSILFTWALVQALLSLTKWGGQKSTSKLPPGPPPLPLFGNLHKLGSKPHISLADLSNTYGPIMTLKLGQVTTIVISSSTIAKQVLQKHDLLFSNRFVIDAMRAHDHFKLSVIWLPVSARWRSLRKILNSHVFSSQRLDPNQDLRSQKVLELIDYVRKSCQAGVAVDIGRVSFRTTLNLLSNTIFSVDLTDLSSDTAQGFKELVRAIMVEAGKPNLVDYFPVLGMVDLQGIRRRTTVYSGKIFQLFRNMIDQRLELRRSTDYNGSNDVLDTLLDRSDEIDPTQMERLISDMFAAGTDTTSSTLEWAMAEILHNPNTLLKAKEELEQTLGKGKPIEESDIANLPYLQAIVKETFRLHPPAPFLIPRMVETDVEICGYIVPSGAQVLVNVWAIGRDPSIWVNPDSFTPERFLGSEIDVRGHDFELIPFGAGRRMCPGLPLGIRMVHLMLGSLINSFNWKLEGGIQPEDIDMEDKFGITVQKAKPLRAIPITV